MHAILFVGMIIMLLHVQLLEESTINHGHEFGEKLGHESNIEIKSCVPANYIIVTKLLY